jgi:hypothetical protein
MKKVTHILVITENENSPVIQMLFRMHIVPVIRRSITSAIKLLKHLHIAAIIIDKENQNIDAIEFILNARDINCIMPIFIPEPYSKIEGWNIIKNLGNITLYNENHYPLKKNNKLYCKYKRKLSKDIYNGNL